MKKIDDIQTESSRQAPCLDGTVMITATFGLHARPAAKLSTIARTARGSVWIEANGEKVDAANTLDILSLGCACGTQVRISIETASDANVLEEILFFIKRNFQEDIDHA